MTKRQFRLIVGITGATGTILGVRLLQVLKGSNVQTHLVLTNWGTRTLIHETSYSVRQVKEMASEHYAAQDQVAAISSSSFVTDAMRTFPCRDKSMHAIALHN